MEVSTPIFQLGFKADPARRGEEWLRRTLAGELAWERMVPGDGNAAYRGRIIDAVYHLTGQALEKGANYEALPL